MTLPFPLPSATLVFLGVVGLALFVIFVALEDRDRGDLVVGVIGAMVVVEALLYPSQNSVPGGLFHPSALGQSFRLPELAIPAALFARLIVRGFPTRATSAGLAWTAFALFYAGALGIGLLRDNPTSEAFFHGKAIIYVVGGAALAAGAPLKRLTEPAVVRRWLVPLSLAACVYMLMSLSEAVVRLSLPMLPEARVGDLGPDATTLLVTLGLIALLLEGSREHRRMGMIAAAIPLVVSPLADTQRGSLIGLVVALLAVGVAMLGPVWRSRMRVTNADALLMMAAMAVPVLLAVMYTSATSSSGTRVPLVSNVSETFFSERKVQSAETRIGLWREGLRQFGSLPLTGWGLGKTYEVERAGSERTLEGGGFHNLPIDLLVRTGLVGLALFAAAQVLTFRAARDAWRRHADNAVATLALACAAATAGLLAKGLVESVFEKFRLATLLGLLVGTMLAAASAVARQPAAAEVAGRR